MSNYADKEKLHDEIVIWQDACAEADAAGVERPVMPDYIAATIMAAAQGMGTRWNFKNYSWVEDMVLDAIEAALKAVPKYDRNNPKKNPFGFINATMWWTFLSRIKAEKQFLDFKHELMLDETHDAFDVGEHDDDIGVSKASMIEQYTMNER